MPSCPQCGAEIRDGDRFCANCGKEVPPQALPGLDTFLEAGIVCPKCDAYNEPFQKTCIACGENLSGLTGMVRAIDSGAPATVPDPVPPSAQGPAPTPTPVATPAAISPPAQPPRAAGPAATFKPAPVFSSTPVPAQRPDPTPAPVSPPRAESNTAQFAVVPPPPPAGRKPFLTPLGSPRQAAGEDAPIELVPKRITSPLASAVPAQASLCLTCRAALPAGQSVCLSCGQRVAGAPPAAAEAPSNLSIRVRLVRGYGREDSTYPVGPQGLTIGRSHATVAIADDPFLAPRHLALRLDQGALLAEDLGGLNGTFLRIRAQTEIKQGAEFIAGNQRFVLLGLGGPTTDVRMPLSQDTRPYGGPVPKQLFVALRLHHATADGRPVGGSVILRTGPIIAIGQRGCDLNFPTDPAMAPHHLELHLKPTGIGLVEIGATSGVFLRLQRPTVLKNGDELLAGDEIFRVEIG